MRPRHIAVFALLGLIWGSEWLVVRGIDLPPLRALAIRYAVAAVVLAIVLMARRVRLPGLKTLLASAFTGVTMLALPTMLTVWGSREISPGLLVVIAAMTPLIAALLEEKAGGRPMTPLVGGIAGTALIASQGLSFSAGQWQGAAAVLTASVLIAGSVVYVKRELGRLQPEVIAVVQLGAAAILVGIASLAFEGHPSQASTHAVLSSEITLAILGNALAFPLYYWLLSSVESFQLTAVSWVTLVVAVAEGLIFVHAVPSGRILGGAAISVTTLWALWRFRQGDDAPLTIEVTSPRTDS